MYYRDTGIGVPARKYFLTPGSGASGWRTPAVPLQYRYKGSTLVTRGKVTDGVSFRRYAF